MFADQFAIKLDDILTSLENAEFKKCTKCGIEKLVNKENFYRNKKMKFGFNSKCKICENAQIADYRKNNREKVLKSLKNYQGKHLEDKKSYRKSLEGKLSEYKNGAKRRKLNFGLTLQQFTLFWQQPCFYCGVAIETVGIDRIVSEKGYTVENCVSCCETCNRMKLNLNLDLFIAKCKIISDKHFKT